MNRAYFALFAFVAIAVALIGTAIADTTTEATDGTQVVYSGDPAVQSYTGTNITPDFMISPCNPDLPGCR
jgi:hypothetical protein